MFTIAISNDSNHFVSGSDDKTIKIWSLYDKKEEFTLIGHLLCVLSVAFSLDKKYIISGSADKSIRI